MKATKVDTRTRKARAAYETANAVLAAARELGMPSGRFRQASPSRGANVLDRILVTFTGHGTANRSAPWLWEDLKGAFAWVSTDDNLSTIRAFHDGGTPVWLLVGDAAAVRSRRQGNFWLFEGDFAAAVDVLKNMSFVEFFIVERNLGWMLAENHHDTLIAVGDEAIEWLRGLPGCRMSNGSAARRKRRLAVPGDMERGRSSG